VTRPLRYLIGLAILAAACSDAGESPMEPNAVLSHLSGTVRVTRSADDGPGSFRQAIEKANDDPSIRRIQLDAGLGSIRLATPLTYSGSQALVINGEGVRLVGNALAADGSALVAEGGGDLTIRGLTVTGAPGNGITIKVPETATGVFTVRLHELVIRQNGLHGVLINDQAEYFDDPFSESEEGSAASVVVDVSDSRFERNGFAMIDSDGIRINEGGEGTLEATIRGSRFVDNGADGVELDERAAGDATFAVRHSSLVGNGSFTSEDFDDGIDVDEGGDGDLIGRFHDVAVNRNFEQGVDLNENGPGSLRAFMVDVRAAQNFEEGIEFEEDDDVEGGGDIEADLQRVTTRRNGSAGGDAGLKLREKGDGNLTARLAHAVSLNNRMTSEEDPISGILVQEDESGDLSLDLVQAVARLNSGAGVTLVQEPDGVGQADVVNLTSVGNDGGPILREGVVVSGGI
jgi:Right handed beta helix region